jgi:uncharacterized protein (TIGR02145 family)
MRTLNYILVVGLTMGMVGCDKNREPAEVQPVAYFKMSPERGNTTTVFHFNTDSVTRQGTRDYPVMVRWDWDADGIWDRMYSTGSEITHRFFKPGNYTIIMEASTLNGKRDSTLFSTVVTQGYSAPRAAFGMSPDSANITNEFTFDASLSKDDEDSLNQLEFRWDFDGDQIWDSGFSSNPLAKHKYSDDENYPVRLEVRDPQQMSSIKINVLKVTRLNDKIVPLFTHECWPCTIEDTVRFDATSSYYQDRPDSKLLYSWDVGNDNLWEETLKETPFYQPVIGQEGKKAIKLRVTDELGLYMDGIDTVELFPMNSAPVTRLVIGNRIGNTGSVFLLHLKRSTDRDNSVMDLVARWDINNDGIWEPAYDGLFEISLTFPAPGRYPVTAMITDPKNKFSTATDTVWVTAGKHETGILGDRRGDYLPTYYGIVKIGKRWWMQSNLKYAPNSKDAKWGADYYNNNSGMEFRYGALYPHVAINGLPDACPKGWHIPKLVEWQQLMTDLGSDAAVEYLMEGGRSEMHVVLAGQKDSDSNTAGVKDKFSGIGQVANFWTSSVNLTGQAYAWYIDPVRKQNKAVLVGKNYWYPIRCIMDE